MPVKKPLAICLMALALTSCKQLELDPVPISYMIEVVETTDVRFCVRYPIVRNDPLTFGDGVDTTCPEAIFGFEADDTPAVTDWIRAQQKRAKQVQSCPTF